MVTVCMITARGHGHTLKAAITIDPDKFGPNEEQEFRVQVTGMFRVQYGEWPEDFIHRTRSFKSF